MVGMSRLTRCSSQIYGADIDFVCFCFMEYEIIIDYGGFGPFVYGFESC